MSLIDKEVIEFACYISGKSREEVEILLEKWKNRDRGVIPEMRKVPERLLKKIHPANEERGLQCRYRHLIEKKQDPDLTAGKFVELNTELQNIEYELNKEE